MKLKKRLGIVMLGYLMYNRLQQGVADEDYRSFETDERFREKI